MQATLLKHSSKGEALLIRTVNGKNSTDYQNYSSIDLATRNKLSDNMKNFDSTLTDWQKQLNKFGKQEHCHFNANMEFLSKFSHRNKPNFFNSLLRFVEI